MRGELVGEDEGEALIGEGCQRIVTGGHTWPEPTPIALTNPGSPSVENPASSTPQVKVERTDPELLRLAGLGAKVYVTVIGRLETRDHFEMVRRGDGKLVPYGYGHQASSIAQIVYEEIKDFTVLPRKR